MENLNLQADEFDNFFDPYLSWAKLTGYRGYSDVYNKKQPLYLLALERLDGKTDNPFPADGANSDPSIGLRPFPANPKIFIGNAGKVEKLEELARDPNYRVELNMTRYYPDQSASNDTLEYAPQPALGKKVIAVIDYGCPFAHHQFLDFKKQHLSSRIKYFWDQSTEKTVSLAEGANVEDVWWFPVHGYYYGREMTESVMSRLMQACLTDSGALHEDAVYDTCGYDTVNDPYCHGGAVMDLAAGGVNPRNSMADAASDADIIFVQLPKDTVYDSTGSSMSVFLLDALSYIIEKCIDAEQLVINLSFGATAGPHNGQTLIERAMDDFLAAARIDKPFRKIDIVLAAGNHHEANLHANIQLTSEVSEKALKWHIMPDDCTDSYMELWSDSELCGHFTVSLRSPSGVTSMAVAFGSADELKDNVSGKTLAALIRPSEYNREQKKYVSLIALAPTHASAWGQAEHGVWSIQLKLIESKLAFVEIDAWIERDDPMAWERGQPQSHFVSSTELVSADELDDTYADARRISAARSDAVSRLGTNSKISNGELPKVVGSYVGSTLVSNSAGQLINFDLSPYSGAGPKHLIDGRTAWPDFIAVGDQTRFIDGIFAAGNRTGVVCRMNGTSVAAPQISRYLINEGSRLAAVSMHEGLSFQAELATRRGKSAKRLA